MKLIKILFKSLKIAPLQGTLVELLLRNKKKSFKALTYFVKRFQIKDLRDELIFQEKGKGDRRVLSMGR